jgi:hypothetical protein
MNSALDASTARPFASRQATIVEHLQKQLSTSGCAFSISSRAPHSTGHAATRRSVDLHLQRSRNRWRSRPTALRMPFHELAHVKARHGLVGAEQELRVAFASSVFPTPVGPRKRRTPIGRPVALRPARACVSPAQPLRPHRPVRNAFPKKLGHAYQPRPLVRVSRATGMPSTRI